VYFSGFLEELLRSVQGALGLEEGVFSGPDGHTLAQVREELEQLSDDDDDMAEMFLTRAAVAAAFTSPGPGMPMHPPAPDMGSAPGSPTLGRVLPPRGTTGAPWGAAPSAYSSVHMDSSDVEELEQLLEVGGLAITCAMRVAGSRLSST